MKSLRGEAGKLVGRSGVDRVDAANGHEIGRVFLHGVGGVSVVPAIADVLHENGSMNVVGAHQFKKHCGCAVGLWCVWSFPEPTGNADR